jgi:signal transduction histidine kinase
VVEACVFLKEAADCRGLGKGEAVARRFRIRHKLLIGFGTVAGVMLLLLGGTLYGLTANRETLRAMDSKHQERQAVQLLREQVDKLLALKEGENGPLPNPNDLLQRTLAVQAMLKHYENYLQDTVLRHRDADNGTEERALVAILRDQLAALEAYARGRNEEVRMGSSPGKVAWPPQLAEPFRKLDQTTANLAAVIDTELSYHYAQSKTDFRNALLMIAVISVVGGVIIFMLVRWAYRWITDPIRELQEKVAKIAQGNFEGQVEVRSGDEMQDLAEEFNAMCAKLQAIYRDLERQVNERSRQLVRSERLAGVGFLAAGVAHEINNPLASISFCSEALERRLKEVLEHHADHPDLPVIQNYLRMIQQEALRCKGITQKLLEFSRVGELARQMTDLTDLVQSVIDMVQHLHCYKGKHVEFITRERPHLMVNAQEIKSVMLNLIVNALESMEAEGTVRIGLETREGQAIITVHDTGCGMTAEVLENIFEPFFTRSRTGKGIGLGLSISHRIVTQHGGVIEADSAGPGQGSTFTVTLPLTAAVPEAVKETPALRLAA